MVNASLKVFGAKEVVLLTIKVQGLSIANVLTKIKKELRLTRAAMTVDELRNFQNAEIFISRFPLPKKQIAKAENANVK